MNRPSIIETRIYLAAALTILTIACMIIFYLDGRTDEALREDREQNEIVDAAIATRDYWHGKYESLADEGDGITIIAAEAKFQRGAANGR